ncbi:MAG: hypothetical protein VCB43_05830 [Myxococcota bacterium]
MHHGALIVAGGIHRFAVTRSHGSSCGTIGRDRLIIESDRAFSEVMQTVDDVATLATGFVCI